MNIVIIGSGNIATHLSKAFQTAGHTISQIYSRTLANATALANVVHTDCVIDNFDSLDQKADLYLIAVSDLAIQQVVDRIPKEIQGIIVHTSGATCIEVLEKFENHGVIYPPQSLNKEIHSDISVIPFGIEANKDSNFKILWELIHKIAPKSFPCNSKQRLALHVSAVISNNFSNLLFSISKQILDQQELDFELLKPIILETAEKVQHNDPYLTQTGPARRGDHNVINKHLEFLSHLPEEKEIYQILTNIIIKRYHK